MSEDYYILHYVFCIPYPGADPEGVQWGCLNPPFGKNYFIFMGILVICLEISCAFTIIIKITQNESPFP